MLTKTQLSHEFALTSVFLILFMVISFPAKAISKQVLPIPHPNIDNLETVVKAQLSDAQVEMTQVIENSEASLKDKAFAYGKMGHLYHAYEFTDAALACYYNAAILLPLVYRWNYCYAFVLQEKGEFEKAIQYYKLAQSINVTSDLIYLVNIRLGDCYQNLNEIDKASLVYELAYKISPEGPAILARMGEIALKQKKYEDAVKYLKTALEKQPDANKLNYPLAMAYRNLGDKESARFYLAKKGKVGIQPDDPLKKKLDSLVIGYRVHILDGKAAFSAKRYEEAKIAFQKAIKTEPKNPAGYVNLGSTHVFLKEYEQALANYEQAIALDPENLTAHYNLGDINLFLKNYEKSVKYLTFYLNKQPNDAQAHFYLAESYKYLRQLEKAFTHYKTAIRLNPDYVEAWVKLSQFLSFNRQYKDALLVLTDAHARLPNNLSIMYHMSTLLASSPDKSIRNGNQSLELSQRVYEKLKNYKTAKAIALSYAQLNQCKRAGEWVETAISLVGNLPGSPEIKNDLNLQKEFFNKNDECTPL